MCAEIIFNFYHRTRVKSFSRFAKGIFFGQSKFGHTTVLFTHVGGQLARLVCDKTFQQLAIHWSRHRFGHFVEFHLANEVWLWSGPWLSQFLMTSLMEHMTMQSCLSMHWTRMQNPFAHHRYRQELNSNLISKLFDFFMFDQFCSISINFESIRSLNLWSYTFSRYFDSRLMTDGPYAFTSNRI